MKLLDLYCCQGGASKGYKDAGFDVVGVDIEYQKLYPFEFVQYDAIEYLIKNGHKYDFIHASPPCQGYSNLTPKDHKAKYKKDIGRLRNNLIKVGKPYVIENVSGAKKYMINPIMLCGSMFNIKCFRHRYFETSFDINFSLKCNHNYIPLLVTTASKSSRNLRIKLGMIPKTVNNAPLAYGIDWMNFNGLKECIPPVYTKWIAEQFLKQIKR